MERGPVFVAGLERTGTSLLYAVLASHPNIAMTRRTNLWTYFYDQFGDLSLRENLDACLDVMKRYKRLVVLKPDYDRLRRDFEEGPRTYGRLFTLLEEQHAERLGKPRWGDKSLNTERYADAIMEAYPGARILHMVRDPRDRFASVLARWKSRRGDVGSGTAEWLSSIELGRRNLRRHPDRYRLVPYESLVADPEATVRSICEFIDEPYFPTMLEMEGALMFRDEGGNSSYGRRDVGTISTASIGRFRDVLSPRQIAFIQVAARRQMRVFGYDPEPSPLPVFEQLRCAVADWPLNYGFMLAWWARLAIQNRSGRRVPEYRFVTEVAA